MELLITYLITINVLTYIIYWRDKKRAERGELRISEHTLIIIALIGGTIGAFLAMKRFRHKTKKLSFRIRIYSVMILQILSIILYLIYIFK